MPTLLYRAAIHDLRGSEILPLNHLRELHPDLYERETAKYAYRPHTIDNPVHPLGPPSRCSPGRISPMCSTAVRSR